MALKSQSPRFQFVVRLHPDPELSLILCFSNERLFMVPRVFIIQLRPFPRARATVKRHGSVLWLWKTAVADRGFSIPSERLASTGFSAFGPRD
jgi:hypothetical protein